MLLRVGAPGFVGSQILSGHSVSRGGHELLGRHERTFWAPFAGREQHAIVSHRVQFLRYSVDRCRVLAEHDCRAR